jgi:uncharacterized small protein (DUF1192 family)
MNTFYTAVRNLVGNRGWSIDQPPSSEEDFLSFFQVQVGQDKNGIAVMSNDPSEFGFTFTDLQNEITRLEADYAAKQYQRDRAAAYPSLAEQMDMQYWDSVNGTTVWADTIAAIKQEHPKP